MTDIEAVDALNQHIVFTSSGGVAHMDKPAALSCIARMAHRGIASELRRCVEAGNFAGNRLIAVSDHGQARGIMAALMSTPYVKDAQDRRKVCLHAFEFADLATLDGLRRAYPAPDVRPVSLRAATRHIREVLRFVAVFPDSVVGHLPAGYAHGFYFVEKFEEAFERGVRPLLERLWSEDSFAALRAADSEALRAAAGAWVHLHEYFHNSSILPISAFIKVKDTRLSGAFEELRVDLCAVLADFDAVLDRQSARLVFEFILAFRLIYYGSNFDPARDYDAITSVALGNVLLERRAVRPADGRRYVLAEGPALRAALRSVLGRLAGAEREIAAALTARGGSAEEQRRLRGTFEALMLELCGASDGRLVRRGGFHSRHAEAMPASLAATG